MDLDSSTGDFGDPAICRHRRRTGDAFMELAAAAALRLAPDYLLAGARTPGAVPHPLRRTGRARTFRPPQFPQSHERALREHDARRAGAIPATHARTLRLRPLHHREQRELKPVIFRALVRNGFSSAPSIRMFYFGNELKTGLRRARCLVVDPPCCLDFLQPPVSAASGGFDRNRQSCNTFPARSSLCPRRMPLPPLAGTRTSWDS